MNRTTGLAAGILGFLAASLHAQSATGTITGRVVFAGRPPGSAVIRMGVDPKCADINSGTRVLQESALVKARGGIRLRRIEDIVDGQSDESRIHNCTILQGYERTLRMVLTKATGVKGFCKNFVPGSNTPWFTMALSVYPDM